MILSLDQRSFFLFSDHVLLLIHGSHCRQYKIMGFTALNVWSSLRYYETSGNSMRQSINLKHGGWRQVWTLEWKWDNSYGLDSSLDLFFPCGILKTGLTRLDPRFFAAICCSNSGGNKTFFPCSDLRGHFLIKKRSSKLVEKIGGLEWRLVVRLNGPFLWGLWGRLDLRSENTIGVDSTQYT